MAAIACEWDGACASRSRRFFAEEFEVEGRSHSLLAKWTEPFRRYAEQCREIGSFRANRQRADPRSILLVPVRRCDGLLAIEVPIGQPQIEWSELASQWCARGDVLRCTIHDGGGEDGREPVIEIDDKQLSWSEFGRMLTTFAGWGMRLVIVPDDETHKRPTIRVRDPNKAKSERRGTG